MENNRATIPPWYDEIPLGGDVLRHNKHSNPRQSWDHYFMQLAIMAASRSTCTRRKVGAVAVDKRHRIIATGYNGAPSGMTHCTKETCIRRVKGIPSGERLDLCKAIHAEANCIISAGREIEGGTLYCTNQPCTSCLKLLMGAGVARIVWADSYNDDYSRQLMQEYGVISTTPEGYKQIIKKEADHEQNFAD